MTDHDSFGKFFLPGPTEVRRDVLEAQLQPMIGHRGKGMEELMARIQPPLKRVFRTQRPVYISASSATGFMEGAVRNAAQRKVLSLVNGAFSERFHAIARACGITADRLDVPWGEAHTPDALSDALKGKGYDAVTIVHSETSTGVLNPIAELTKAAHEMGDIAVLIDSVTGVAGAPVETDAWELDFVLTGSQKALALPPGLAFGVVTEALLARARANTSRGVYFDFVEFEKSIANNQTPNTPALSLLFALAKQLERIEAEGIEVRWSRHAAMAQRTWTWVAEMRERGISLTLPVVEKYRSPTVTCIALPPGASSAPIVGELKKRGFVIGAGYGKMKDTQIRIGHMGDHTVAELDVLLDQLASILQP
jgi:predicted phosphoserine aminotransferase